MADFATHFIMGGLVLSQPEVDADFIMANRTAFNWGLQGPDLLYFYSPMRLSRQLHNAGTLLHKKDTEGVMHELARYVMRCPEPFRNTAKSYFYGFICHYALDSLIHPYVNYHTRRITDKTGRLRVHMKIESHISASVSAYYKLMTDKLRPPAFTADYHASPALRKTVSGMLNHVLFECFNVLIPPSKIHSSFYRTFLLQEVLVNGASLLRPPAEFLEKSFGVRYLFSSNFKCPIPDWDCLNRTHRVWRYDDGRTKSSLSVIDIMQRSANLAVSLIAGYEDMFEQSYLERIPYIRNFSGEIL